MRQLIKEFLTLLRQEKKLWLIPLAVLVLIVAALLWLSGGSVLGARSQLAPRCVEQPSRHR